MCGIAGIFNQDQKSKVTDADIFNMIDQIVHRGPDEGSTHIQGNIGLGFRRLSIIDISNGSQPMKDHNTGNYIIFNGEIYNYLELKNELLSLGYSFKTKSDTEVLLKMYLHYGEKCLKKLNGMFAFAIWNPSKNNLFLARDRIGKKPLYYYHKENIFYFASELKCFKKIDKIQKKISLTALDSYLSYDGIESPMTIYKDIYELPAANYMIISENNICQNKYWDLNDLNDVEKSFDDYKSHLKELILDSTKKRMISDVPLGIFLSGGIDSSIIAGVASKNSSNRIKTYSMKGGEDEYNELPFADKVAKFNNSIHHEFSNNEFDLSKNLPSLADSFDQPFSDSSMIPTYYVSKFASEHVKVALSGEGGDELFGGYERYQNLITIYEWKKLPNKVRIILSKIFNINKKSTRYKKNKLISLLKKVSIMNRISLNSSDKEIYNDFIKLFDSNDKKLIYSDFFKEKINKFHNRNSIMDEVFSNYDKSSILKKAQLLDFKKYLHDDILVKVDRMSMKNSLEVRSPLLDYRIVELAFSMPDKIKINGKKSKYILRESMQKYIPIDIYNRNKKRGFSVPISQWIRDDLKYQIKESILDSNFIKLGLFNEERIEKMINQHHSNQLDHGPQIWSLYILSLWMQNNYISL